MPVCSEYALARLENTLSNVTVSALAMCMVRDKPTEKATEPCPWSPREVPPGPACAFIVEIMAMPRKAIFVHMLKFLCLKPFRDAEGMIENWAIMSCYVH